MGVATEHADARLAEHVADGAGGRERYHMDFEEVAGQPRREPMEMEGYAADFEVGNHIGQTNRKRSRRIRQICFALLCA